MPMHHNDSAWEMPMMMKRMTNWSHLSKKNAVNTPLRQIATEQYKAKY
jgi:hypothetical protein